VLRSFLKRFGRKSSELRIALCEDRIFVSPNEQIALTGSAEGPSWGPAVEALPRILAAHKKETANIVLADQFVRYALLPWSDTLKTHAQWLAFARHRFCAIHGPIANEWEIKFAETAPAGPRLACAVDIELVDALAARFSGTGVDLVSVLPFLVAAFNRVRHMTGGSCWLVIEEPGRLTLALFLRGVWVAIRSRRSDRNWRSALAEIIERESAFLGIEEPCTRVILCVQDGAFETQEHEQVDVDSPGFRLEALNYQDLALAGN
jgi:hypothetical protein